MGDVDSVRLQIAEVEQRQSSVRQTPSTSFAQRLQTGLGATIRLVSNTAGSAGYAIPGAAVLGAAVSNIGTVKDLSGGLTSNSTAGDWSGGSAGFGMGSTGGGGLLAEGGGAMGAIAGRAAAGDPSSQMLMATQQMQEMNQTFNLQYLQLQQKMQNESRQFTAVSNVMKTKHDTARNALSNLK